MPQEKTQQAIRHRHHARLTHLIGGFFDTVNFLSLTIYPFVDLAIRIWLAQAFLKSGLIKLFDWNLAITLAKYEYPVEWLNPTLAAVFGLSIEVVCSILLIAGLATRWAALALLALTLVIQFEYKYLFEHWIWVILFSGYIFRGAGSISVDQLLSRGINDSAFPGARIIMRFNNFLAEFATPLLFLAIRLLIAYSLWTHLIPMLNQTFNQLLAICIAAGLGTRFISAFLLVTYATQMGNSNLMLFNCGACSFALLALLIVEGAKALSLDQLLKTVIGNLFPIFGRVDTEYLKSLPHVVVAGAGFAGIKLVKSLRHTACRITLVDRHNYHLFQPLLYQVATAGLSPSDIALPIRSMFRQQTNACVLMNNVIDVNPQDNQIVLGNRTLDYDYLVLATGARHSYFGKDHWEPYAPGLKQIEDATDIRRRLLTAFEQAENATDKQTRQAYLTIAIVGGGPTGVELAGAIAELANWGMTGEFQNINPADTRILLIQSAPRLLPAFDEKSSIETKKSLEELGIEVRLENRVDDVTDKGVLIGDELIPARTVFWAAGVAASPVAKWLDCEADRSGRVEVNEHFNPGKRENIFVIGDAALSNSWNGKPIPGLAPAAKQAAKYVADIIQAKIENSDPPEPFVYRHMGNLATIGRKSAVAEIGKVKLKGPLAWWFWGAIHVGFLSGVRNRFSVAIQWFWAYLTFSRSTRLITGQQTTEIIE